MTPDLDRAAFLARLDGRIGPDDLVLVEEMYQFAKEAHRPQRREGGARYFEHPRAVAWIAVDELGLYDWEIVVLALGHDVLEDSYLLTPYRDRDERFVHGRLARLFGPDVATGLLLLTHEPRHSAEEYVGRLREVASWTVLVVKLCDRLHNLRTLDACPPDKRARKITETRALYLPLVDVLADRIPPERRDVPAHLRDRISRNCDRFAAD